MEIVKSDTIIDPAERPDDDVDAPAPGLLGRICAAWSDGAERGAQKDPVQWMHHPARS